MNGQRHVSRQLVAGGLAFILAAVLYNEFSLSLVDPDPPLEVRTVTAIRHVQVEYFVIGLALLVSGGVITRISWLDSLARKRWAARALITVLPISSLLLFVELGLRPFARTNLTTIYIKDDTLGWKMKPNAHDVWGGVPVSINGKGLRGRELAYVKPSHVRRILFLGDSVTFGYRLTLDEDTFPALVESLLDKQSGADFETINAGVGGYSPWQEYAYLTAEGIKYQPDLIVVSFVLNDVTEKFGLIRFGGTGVGFQLQNTVSGPLERFLRGSSIAFFGRTLLARSRFGVDVQEGARKQESLDVEDLVHDPDRPFVRQAWDTTLGELGDIFSYAKVQGIPLVLVVFPYLFQFDDPARLSAPQQVVTKYAAESGVPVIDLLPLLAQTAESKQAPQELFIDEDHLSVKGSRLVAQILADHFERLKW